jgi:hypothetical protein
MSDDLIVGKGNLDGKAIFANRNFAKGEVVIHYNLTLLSEARYNALSELEKMFVHTHSGEFYLYGEPERYVNHSDTPNTFQDLKMKCDIALRDIKKGEKITTDSSKDDID